MDSDKISTILEKIYIIHDDFIKNKKKACKKLCSSCCTVNITLTTLEGLNIIQYLENQSRMDELVFFDRSSTEKRYQPKMTTNKFAELILNKEEIPQEENIPEWGRCPFLSDKLCSIYDVRPMGCRSMISKENCSENDIADMDEFVITMNMVFLQFIEHIDIPGFYGNMSDMLIFLKNNYHFEQNHEKTDQKNPPKLLKNLPMKMLLVPPEHKESAMPVIQAIQNVCF